MTTHCLERIRPPRNRRAALFLAAALAALAGLALPAPGQAADGAAATGDATKTAAEPTAPADPAPPAAPATDKTMQNGPKELAYGLRFLKERMYPRAIAHLTAAIRTRSLEPKLLSDAHYFRGRALTRTQRPGLALDDFTRAVTYWPENVKALRVRCRQLTLMKEFDKAQEDCDQAVLLAPEDWRGWFTRGLLRKETKQRDLAETDFSAAQMRMPDGMETFPAVARQLREFDLLEDPDAWRNDPNAQPQWTED